MGSLQKYYKQSATYKIFSGIFSELVNFLDTLGKITQNGIETLKCIFKGQINFKEGYIRCF